MEYRRGFTLKVGQPPSLESLRQTDAGFFVSDFKSDTTSLWSDTIGTQHSHPCNLEKDPEGSQQGTEYGVLSEEIGPCRSALVFIIIHKRAAIPCERATMVVHIQLLKLCISTTKQ